MGERKKVNLSSVVALRTECDETLPQALASLKYTESFTVVDTRLALGLLSVAIAGGLYYYEKKFGDDLKDLFYYYLLLGGVTTFFVLNGLLYLHAQYVQKNTKYVGYNKDKKVVIGTSTKNATTPVYDVEFKVGDSPVAKDSISFSELFTEDGYLKLDSYIGFIKKNLEKVSKKST
ncbi:unnamed protein product [Kuraishia capsulata CBS 1993]|uniref:Signal peptidase complex subunit 2 n=1 Tax=Kuraishia capsulata CBS 1993 TaxID=1382522 RepID=W6MIH4_9ASCO|nr:uncharacterized protein KUCA_T00000117001 [Kuraishia capsulata CBS 1993]CDK24157.1 unnamed protein product [Kuraishia capsulata CBS 1993]